MEAFFTEYGEAGRYELQEIIGKGSYGVVCSARDRHTGETVAIKKIDNLFEHVSDATRILREVKLLRLLKHPDIVEIKHILLPESQEHFSDLFVVFERMDTDLHQVIKVNRDLGDSHHCYFLYQLLRGLKYIHTSEVFHRDLKPKNILANADCNIKICDFGLARPMFTDAPQTVFWTDYVATRWYRAPELCGCFFARYQPTVDVWSMGCIFAELLMGKALFPGRNVVDQLTLITDILGTPAPEVIEKVRNEKSRAFLERMPKKRPVPLHVLMPDASENALDILGMMLTFDPDQRPGCTELLAHPYFKDIGNVSREPMGKPMSRVEFAFDQKSLKMSEVRQLLYEEALEYHPKMKEQYFKNEQSSYVYPSVVDRFKKEFTAMEQGQKKVLRSAASLPKGTAFREMVSRDSLDRSDSMTGGSRQNMSTSLGTTSGTKFMDSMDRGKSSPKYASRDVAFEEVPEYDDGDADDDDYDEGGDACGCLEVMGRLSLNDET
jgi:serine/threonine protein kinase